MPHFYAATQHFAELLSIIVQIHAAPGVFTIGRAGLLFTTPQSLFVESNAILIPQLASREVL
jgi:hypothetical protein